MAQGSVKPMTFYASDGFQMQYAGSSPGLDSWRRNAIVRAKWKAQVIRTADVLEWETSRTPVSFPTINDALTRDESLALESGFPIAKNTSETVRGTGTLLTPPRRVGLVSRMTESENFVARP